VDNVIWALGVFFLGLSQRGGPNENSEGPWVPK